MSLVILLRILCVQNISGINISIIRSLRLCCWITTSVVFLSVYCVLEIWCGWCWVVLVLQAEAQLQPAKRAPLNTSGFLYIHFSSSHSPITYSFVKNNSLYVVRSSSFGIAQDSVTSATFAWPQPEMDLVLPHFWHWPILATISGVGRHMCYYSYINDITRWVNGPAITLTRIREVRVRFGFRPYIWCPDGEFSWLCAPCQVTILT